MKLSFVWLFIAVVGVVLAAELPAKKEGVVAAGSTDLKTASSFGYGPFGYGWGYPYWGYGWGGWGGWGGGYGWGPYFG